MKNQKVIFFDLYKTLIDIKINEQSKSAYKFMSDWLSYNGIIIKPKVLFDSFVNITRQKVEENTEQYPDIDIGTVFEQILANADNRSQKSTNKNFIQQTALLFRKSTTQSLVLFPDTKIVLESLKNKVRLAVISNAQRLFTMPELLKFEISKYFEYILFSSDVKVCKPNPKIFYKALNDLKIEPDNAIFIGDSLFDDISGAKKAGIKTIWINHQNNKISNKKDKFAKPDIEIKFKNFSKLPEIILSMNS